MSQEQLNFLKGEIDARIKSTSDRRTYYRKNSFYTAIGVAGLAALASVILGLHTDKWSEEIRITSLVLTGLISVISSYAAFLSPKELWISNNNALNGFYKLRFDIEYCLKGSGQIDDPTLEKFKTRYQEILDQLNFSWQKNRAETQKQ